MIIQPLCMRLFLNAIISNINICKLKFFDLLFYQCIGTLIQKQIGKIVSELANFWFVFICNIKRQFCRYSKSENFKISDSFQFAKQNLAVSLKNIFIRALFCSFCILLFCLGLYAPTFEIQCPHSRWKEKKEYVNYRVLRDVLFLIFLSILMAQFSFVIKWFVCFNHSEDTQVFYCASWSQKFPIQLKDDKLCFGNIKQQLVGFQLQRSKFYRLAIHFAMNCLTSIFVSSAK